MQKAVIPASFLSKALGTGVTFIQNENQLYLIREEGKAEKVSPLYRLFFEREKMQNEEKDATEQPPSEPDDYTSYE